VTTSPSRVPPAAVTSPVKTGWLTAEEEKLRFQQAQAAVHKNQGIPYTPSHARNDSDSSIRGQASSGGSGTKPSAAAALYAQAISAQARSAPGPGPSTANLTSPSRPKPTVPQYLTADEEKAALRRYEEAKQAVDRTQLSDYTPNHTAASSAPIAYESLFPSAASTSRPTDEPPPFESSSSAIPQSHLSEKDRLRRAYEANDAAARARQNTPPPPLASPPTHDQYANALEEKEALRKKFEARDNSQAKGTLTPQPPPKATSVGGSVANASSAANGRAPSPGRSPSTNARPTPLPPATSRVLSAVEEKALLRAKFEARDAPANRRPALTNGNSLSSPAVPSTPPPLMPRPPVEYIKETQEEDARVSRLNGEVPVIDLTPDTSRREVSKPHGSSQPTSPSPSTAISPPGKLQAGISLDINAFTSFRDAFEGTLASGSPSALPTKLPGE